MKQKKRRFAKSSRERFSVAKLMPNILTLAALCSGLSSIRFALEEQWSLAVVAMLVAGFLDALDGKVARLLGQSSHFGGELDSLSDMVSFGVVPAVVLYLRELHIFGEVGWIVSLFYAVCMALRLARFNTASFSTSEKAQEAWQQKFFVGVPAPTGAFLSFLPIYFSMSFPGGFYFHPAVVCVYVVLVSLLCISRIPTFSIKGYTISIKKVLPLLLMVGVVAATLISIPWVTLSIICGLYLGSIFFSYNAYAKLSRL